MPYQVIDHRVSDIAHSVEDLRHELRSRDGHLRGMFTRLDQSDAKIVALSTRMTEEYKTLSTEIGEIRSDIKVLRSNVALMTEVIKWVAVAVLAIAGMWDRLPEPLRSKLLGG